jgi:phospholipid/cholesterol/gamma-HCH transport system permease protein
MFALRRFPLFLKLAGILGYWLDLLAFYSLAAKTFFRSSRAGRRLATQERDRQIFEAGVQAVPLTILVAVVLGGIILTQAIDQLKMVGASESIGNLLVVIVLRELGPLIPALLVLGRSGTACTITLFDMRMNGEINVLESMGIDPMRYLVLPRIIGITTAVVGLAIFFNLFVILGSYLLSALTDMNLLAPTFFNRVADAIRWPDLILLYVKANLFGLIISGICCYHGLAVRRRGHDIYGMARSGMMKAFVAIFMADIVFVFIYFYIH